MAKRIDAKSLPETIGTLYPPPYDQPCRVRGRRKLGDAAGLTQFGVNLLRLPPGAWSSQRHWHATQDEFIYVLAGQVVLATNDGEEILGPGDCAGFKAGEENGHHLMNRDDTEALVLEIGSRAEGDRGFYSDIDLETPPGGKPALYTHKDGRPYTDLKRRGPEDS